MVRYIEKIKIKLDNSPKIDQDFELGDLTIIIGRTNSAKTRILRHIFELINPLNEQLIHTKGADFKRQFSAQNIEIMQGLNKLESEYVRAERNPINSSNMTKSALNDFDELSKILDPSIEEVATDHIIFRDGTKMNMQLQGSGIHSINPINAALRSDKQLILIDEPERGLFPYGKIGFLEKTIFVLDKKQIIFTTHDPTLINPHLISQIIIKQKEINSFDYGTIHENKQNSFAPDFIPNIKIYSFSNGVFNKVDFDVDSKEMYGDAGYLSQTYSNKPIHLMFEGLTELHLFPAILIRYGLFKKIDKFFVHFNKISFTNFRGSQWKIQLEHLPHCEYYKTFVLLDGDQREKLDKIIPCGKHSYDPISIGGNLFNRVPLIVLDSEKVQFPHGFPMYKCIHITTLEKKDIEEAFKPIFGDDFFKKENNYSKLYSLSQKIFEMNDKEFEDKILNSKELDIQLIIRIIRWALAVAQYDNYQIQTANQDGLLP